MLCVMSQVIVHERGNEIVTVVIARMATQFQGDSRVSTSLLKHFRIQLLLKKLVQKLKLMIGSDAVSLR